MNFAIILAAGKGRRFGKEKQFAILNKKPLIYYSIQKFNTSLSVDKITIVTTKNRIDFIKKLITKYNFYKVREVIIGGRERQDSASNAISILPDKGYVAIHDSARPLITLDLIKQGFKVCKTYKAAIPILPVLDTIKTVNQNKISKTIDRSQLCLVQTPQFFEINLLKAAYQKAKKDKYYATDDANLIERLGIKVMTFPGLKQNIKITDKVDLKLVKAFL